MEERKKPKGKKKKSAEGNGEEKVHKVPWQEKYATPAEIKQFLSDHIYLRYNTVKHRVEARLPAEDAFCQNSELVQFVSDDYQPMNDRLKNTLLTALQGIELKGTGPVSSLSKLYRFRAGNCPKLLYNPLITNKMKKETKIDLKKALEKKT